MKFIVTHTSYQIVTGRYLIEAETEDEAFDQYLDGSCGERLSEDIDQKDSEVDVAEAEQNPDGIWTEKENPKL